MTYFDGSEPVPHVASVVLYVDADTRWSDPSGGQQPRMAWLQKKNPTDWLWWRPRGRLAPEFLQCYVSSSALKNVIRHKERHTWVSSLLRPLRPSLLSSLLRLGS